MDIEKYYFNNIDISVPFYGMSIIVNYIFFAKEKPEYWHSPTHCHAGYELHFMPQGRGILKADNVKYDIKVGSLFLIGPGIYHELISDRQDALSQHCISFDIDFNHGGRKPVESYLLPECRELEEFFRDLSFWIGTDQNEFGELFDELHKEFISPVIGSYALVCSNLTKLIVEFIRFVTGYKRAQYSIPRKTADEVRKIIIDKAFNNNYVGITKKLLAEELHVSIRQLERVISQNYGMSFNEKLLHSRIEHAKVQLLTTDHTIEIIAEDNGFPSTGSFSSAFKKLVNTTPGKYRMENRGD